MSRIPLASLLGLSLLALVACPAKPAETPKPGDPPPTDTTTGGVNLPEWTKTGNTYFAPTQTNPPTLDPAQVSDTTSSAICDQIFDTLLTLDDNLDVAPELATAWTIDPDNITYHFTLRDNAKFHNGRTVVAEDFKWSFQRLLDPTVASKRANWVEPIAGAKEFREGKATEVTGITVQSPTELTITLSAPYAPFIYHLTQISLAVIPKEAVEAVGNDQFTKNPVGSGAFKFVGWQENEWITLQANKEYWRKSPSIDGIVYKVIKENRQQYEEYKLGNLHHCWVEPVAIWPLVQEDPVTREEVHTYPLASLMYYGFNMEKAPFGLDPGTETDPEAVRRARLLRQAASYAIDRKYICTDIMKDQGVPYNKVIPPGLGSYVGPSDTPAYDYNPTKATELLAEAGYPNGEGLPPITLWFNKEGSHPDIAAAIQNDLKKVGISVETRTMEWASYIEAVDNGEPQFFRMGWVQDYPDPDNWLYVLFHTKNKGPQGNASRYSNAEVDALLEQAQVITDPPQRMALYQQAERMILNDAPWIIIEHGVNQLLVKPNVKGMVFTAMDSADTIGHIRFEDVQLAK